MTILVPSVALQLLTCHCWWSGTKLQLRHNLRIGCLSAFTWFQSNRYVADDDTASLPCPHAGWAWSWLKQSPRSSVPTTTWSTLLAPPGCLTKQVTAGVKMLDVLLWPWAPLTTPQLVSDSSSIFQSKALEGLDLSGTGHFPTYFCNLCWAGISWE